jgi:hypothetical protein
MRSRVEGACEHPIDARELQGCFCGVTGVIKPPPLARFARHLPRGAEEEPSLGS